MVILSLASDISPEWLLVTVFQTPSQGTINVLPMCFINLLLGSFLVFHKLTPTNSTPFSFGIQSAFFLRHPTQFGIHTRHVVFATHFLGWNMLDQHILYMIFKALPVLFDTPRCKLLIEVVCKAYWFISDIGRACALRSAHRRSNPGADPGIVGGGMIPPLPFLSPSLSPSFPSPKSS